MQHDHDEPQRRPLAGQHPKPGPGKPGQSDEFPVDRQSGKDELPIGLRFGEFEIVRMIGKGGFGIVYLAYDHSLQRHVALKEYMPSAMACRKERSQVTITSAQHREAFSAGLRSFINEAKMLARFDSPSLVKVFRFWEANGTAYMVMPYYEGITLKQACLQQRIRPSEDWIKRFLAGVFDAIEIIHEAKCLHRDIAPDNILLLKNGRPLLLDFGAARHVIGDMTQMLTAIVKPGFAPIEQYTRKQQGPWTDIYALGAVVYYLISGKRPPPSLSRLGSDDMPPAREVGQGRYTASFLSAIDRALAVEPAKRLQSVADFRAALAAKSEARSGQASSLPRRSGNAPSGTGKSGRAGLGRQPASPVNDARKSARNTGPPAMGPASARRPAANRDTAQDNAARERMPLTRIASALYRISGAMMFLLLPFVLLSLHKSLASKTSFEYLMGMASHWFAKLMILALCWGCLLHFCEGLRLLIVDCGLARDRSARSAAAVLIASLLLTALVALKLFRVF